MNIKTSQLKEIIKNALLETINSDESVDEGFLDKVKRSLNQYVVEPFKKEFNQALHPPSQQTPKTQISVPPVINNPLPIQQNPQQQTPSTPKKRAVQFNTAPTQRLQTTGPRLKMMPKGRTVYRPPSLKSPQKSIQKGKKYPKLVRGNQGKYKLEETITEEQLKNFIKIVIEEIKV